MRVGGGGGGGFWVITCMFPSCLNSMGMGLCVLLCYEHVNMYLAKTTYSYRASCAESINDFTNRSLILIL